MRYTNQLQLSLPMAVFLADDTYDYVDMPNYISATSLLKSTRQFVLGKRANTKGEMAIDISTLVPSRLGTALHDGIERSWSQNRNRALAKLGYPQKVIDRIRINPTKEDLEKDPSILPVYMEQRVTKKVGKWHVGGKYDFVWDGRVDDFKSTSTYTYVNKTNDDKYIKQGSIYRWLNPDIITKDFMAIQFLFTDWQKARASQDKNYPQTRVMEYILDLMPISDTDKWVKARLKAIDKALKQDEEDLPECTPKELWMGDSVFKYYKSGKESTRSTKNFTTFSEACKRKADDGGTGLVVEVKGKARACLYCSGYDECTQKDRLIEQGLLDV